MKILQRFAPFSRSMLAGLLAAGCWMYAHAAERVYLRSGSDLVCDHRKNMAGQVRLYLTASEENYLDVVAADIVRTEPVVAVSESSKSAQATQISADIPALLDHAGAQHHLDPDLLASVVRAESGGQSRVVSRAGAQGLMQLMPGTAAELGVQDSFAPEQNIAGGTAYLDALLTYYHEDLALALAAYNAGPAAVDRYRGIPPYAETRRYVERVIHDYNRRKLEEARHPAAHVPPVSFESAASNIATR